MAVYPYGPASPEFVVGPEFAHMWCSALAHCQKRFEGKISHIKREPSRGIGAFTPDNFPIFDVFREHCYFIADFKHGYKMIDVGKLVAQEIFGEPPHYWSRFAFRATQKEPTPDLEQPVPVELMGTKPLSRFPWDPCLPVWCPGAHP